jgi:hypothetical protein
MGENFVKNSSSKVRQFGAKILGLKSNLTNGKRNWIVSSIVVMNRDIVSKSGRSRIKLTLYNPPNVIGFATICRARVA